MKPSALAQPAASRSAAQPATEWGSGMARVSAATASRLAPSAASGRRGGHAAAINAPSR